MNNPNECLFFFILLAVDWIGLGAGAWGWGGSASLTATGFGLCGQLHCAGRTLTSGRLNSVQLRGFVR